MNNQTNHSNLSPSLHSDLPLLIPNSSVIFNLLWAGRERQLLIWTVFNVLVGIGGVALNLITLVVLIILERARHSSCRILILHLLVIDLIQCAFSLPLSMVYQYYPRVSGRLECFLLRVPFMCLECTTNWCATFLALNRCIAILFPLQYRVWSRERIFDIGAVTLPWIFGVLLNLPYFTGYGGFFTMGPPTYRCYLKESPKFPVENILYLGFVMPMAVLVGLYVVAGLKMVHLRWTVRRDQQIQVHVVDQNNEGVLSALARSQERRFALAKMLFVAAILYMMLYLPNPIVVWVFPSLVTGGSPIYRMWLRTIYVTGFLVNPVRL